MGALTVRPEASPPAPGRRPPLLLAALQAMRPKQWTKNAFLFAALVFSFEFLDPEPVLQALWAFGCFCLVSSAGYIINDLRDREADAQHPKKRKRAIASGALPVPAARAQAVVIGVLGLGAAWALSPSFALVTLAYFVTTMSYSLYFKNIVILDIMFLSSGFMWRAIAGAVAIQVHISAWLLLCTGFLALFLGFNKRRGELIVMGDKAGSTRKTLTEYSPALLDEFQSITTSGTVVSYALYTVLGSPTSWLLITMPYVLYFIFRYIYLVQMRGEGGAPDETLTSDRPVLVAAVLYVATVVGVLLLAPDSPARVLP